MPFRWVLVAIMAFAFEAVPPAAQAGVKVKVSKTYYPVSGRSGESLNAAMLRGGGARIRLTDAVAATETKMDFSEPKIGVNGSKCVIEDVDVILDIRYTFPKWTDRAKAPKAVQQRWDAFYRELVRHEEEHGRIAKRGAEAFERELRKLSGNVSFGCRDFGLFARQRLDTVIRQTAAAQQAFDRIEYGAASTISKAQRLLYEAR